MSKYKEEVDILPLAMVDDLLSVARCGFDSIAMNAYMNVAIELKKLRFHTVDDNGKSKCHQIHIGKDRSFVQSAKSMAPLCN